MGKAYQRNYYIVLVLCAGNLLVCQATGILVCHGVTVFLPQNKTPSIVYLQCSLLPFCDVP